MRCHKVGNRELQAEEEVPGSQIGGGGDCGNTLRARPMVAGRPGAHSHHPPWQPVVRAPSHHLPNTRVVRRGASCSAAVAGGSVDTRVFHKAHSF